MSTRRLHDNIHLQLGRVSQITDPLNNAPSLVYTPDSNVQQYKDAGGATSNLTWDANNKLTASKAPTGSQSAFTYGDSFHPYSPTSVKDEQGNTLNYAYDANGNLASVTDGLGAQNKYTFTYNANGTRASMTDALGNITSYAYDAYGNHTGTTYPAPLGGESNAYDQLSRLIRTTDGKGQATTFAYDAMDRVTSITYADGSVITNAYDADGNPTSVADNTGTTSYTYDGLNRLTKKTLPGGAAIIQAFDAAGNMTALTDTGGTVTYAYNGANLLTSLTEPNGLKTSFTYDGDQNRTSTAYPNGVTMSESYDSSRRLVAISAKNASGVTLTSYTYSFANPSTGLDTSLRYAVTDLSNNKTAYSYDALNRLTDAKTTNSSGAQIADYQYAYDGNGNRTSQTANGNTTTFSFNNGNQLQSAGYAYDANGNQTAKGTGMSLSHNAKDQTASITPPSSSAISMTYSGKGQEQRVVAGASTFAYNALGLGTDGQTSYTRDTAGGLTEERTAAGNYYYLFDGLDSVIGLTDSSGNLVDTYSYDPYGQLVSSSGSVPNPWRFVSAYYDAATSLYKMGERYYDPTLGRWSQEDEVRGGTEPQSINLYAYAKDNPVNVFDPDGKAGYFRPPRHSGKSHCGHVCQWWSRHNPFRSWTSAFTFGLGVVALGVGVIVTIHTVALVTALILAAPETGGLSLVALAAIGPSLVVGVVGPYMVAGVSFRHAFNLQ